MIAILIGAGSGVGVFISGIIYMWIQVKRFDANFKGLLNAIADGLEHDPDEMKIFITVKEKAVPVYQSGRKKRVKMAMGGFAVLGAIVGLLALFAVLVFTNPTYTPFHIFINSVFAASTFIYYLHFLDKCCVLQGDSASSSETWLGVILPSTSRHGKLDLVQGSMNPILLSQAWFFQSLVWLQKERQVTIRILSGPPKLKEMDGEQFKKWKQYWDNIMEYGFQNNVRIVKERPQLQFVVTNRIVQIESDHHDWVTREKEEKKDMGSSPLLVSNHVHMFDRLLIRRFRDRFEEQWRNGRSALEIIPLEYSSRSNYGRES